MRLRYVANCTGSDGYGEAARHQIVALGQHGFEFDLPPMDGGQLEGRLLEAAKSVPRTAQPGATIWHRNPLTAAAGRGSEPRPHVLVTVWEASRLSSPWVGACNQFDQVWCPTRWQLEVFAASGVDRARLRYVPFALCPELATPQAEPWLPEAARPGDFVFLSVFQWSERKGGRDLIHAFSQAFDADDRVTLVIKTNKMPNVDMGREIAQALKDTERPGRPPIVVVDRLITAPRLEGLYQAADAYVTLTRGEGWGFPMHAAMLARRPVIATNWSAHAEWAAGGFLGVPYELMPVEGMPERMPYRDNQQWAVPDVGGAVDLMRLVAAMGPQEQEMLGARAYAAATRIRPADAAEAARRALSEG
jgi:glycosyltransferase involved in cell wall biosynthesis